MEYPQVKISLPDITLVAVSTIKIQETIEAIKKSYENIDFGDVLFLTDKKPNRLPKKIKYLICPRIKDINDYNLFVFKYLETYINSPFCLMIQYDSWVINPNLWDNAWLQYDYIGAPWIIKNDAYIWSKNGEHIRVGNGGFSLRSRRLLEAPNRYNLPLLGEQGWYNEDGNICIYHRETMLKLGIQYAPVEIAAKFSYENPVPENIGVKTFGFHKNYPPQ